MGEKGLQVFPKASGSEELNISVGSNKLFLNCSIEFCLKISAKSENPLNRNSHQNKRRVLRMQKTSEMSIFDRSFAIQVIGANGKPVGKVMDNPFTDNKVASRLIVVDEEGKVQTISLSDTEAALSISRFYRYYSNCRNYSNGQVLLCEVDGEVVGFVKLVEFRVGANKFGFVIGIYVHKRFRRRGFASTLLKLGTGKLKCDNALAVFATVNWGNTPSLGVFDNEGYRKTGFVGLRRRFGWHVFKFYQEIWCGLGDIVLVHD